MRRLNKYDLLAIFAILVISILLALPLLKQGLYQIHDDQQIARLYLLDQAFKSGQFPVRWVDQLGFGFGYPLFVFYPPLVYVVGEIFHLLGFSIINSIKIDFFLSILLSGLAMYMFAKQISGRIGGLTASFFYMMAPYRAIDVYIRGALSEAFSFVWLPLILLSFYLLGKNGGKYLVLSALSLTLLMITHNLVFLPFMVFFPIYLLFLFTTSPKKKEFLKKSLLSIILSLGLSAFFWLPSLLEKQFTIVDQILLKELANFQIHFVYPQQLWDSLWGYGGSGMGANDGLSFKIGKLHIIVSTLVLIYIVLQSLYAKINSKQNKVAILFIILLVLSAFMTTEYSKPLWELFSPLEYLQFPWRFLIFTTLFSSILAGLFVYYFKLPIFKILVSLILLLTLFVTNYKLFQPQKYRGDLTDQSATNKKVINWEISKTSFEYSPKGVELVKSDIGTSLINITPDKIPEEKIEIEKGEGTISNVQKKPHVIDFKVNASSPSQIKANVFNFPGWKVFVDNQRQAIDDDNELKLITFPVSVGQHDVKIEFTNTTVRNIGNVISILSLAVLLVLLHKKWPKISF